MDTKDPKLLEISHGALGVLCGERFGYTELENAPADVT
jgi:hypothetical protein